MVLYILSVKIKLPGFMLKRQMHLSYFSWIRIYREQTTYFHCVNIDERHTYFDLDIIYIFIIRMCYCLWRVVKIYWFKSLQLWQVHCQLVASLAINCCKNSTSIHSFLNLCVNRHDFNGGISMFYILIRLRGIEKIRYIKFCDTFQKRHGTYVLNYNYHLKYKFYGE